NGETDPVAVRATRAECPILPPCSSQTLTVVEAFVSNACLRIRHWQLPSVPHVHMLKYAHRQIHAEDAGGAAGGTGSAFAGQSSGNHKRAFSFCASGPGRRHNAAAS